MKKILLFTILLILTAANSFAAEPPQQDQEDGSLYLGVTSWRVLGAKAYHVNLGKYYSGKHVLSLEYGKGKYEHLELVNSARPTFDYINAGAYYRRFIGDDFSFMKNLPWPWLKDSLNLFFGLYRQYWKGDFKYNVCDHDNINYGDCPTSRGQQVKIDFNMEVTLASLGLGTHWVFDSGFMFGVDWLILSQPLYRYTDTFIHETAPGFAAKSQIQDDLDRLEEKIVKISTYPTVVVVTMGWFF